MVLTGSGDDTSPQELISLTVETWAVSHYHLKGMQASTGGKLRNQQSQLSFSEKKNPGDTVIKTAYEETQTKFSSLQCPTTVASKGKVIEILLLL